MTALAAGLSIVVPVYNSEQSIPLLVDSLTHTLTEINQPYEIILIDDGSKDGSWSVIRALAVQQPALQAITLMRNYGQHNAILCGIRAAQFNVIVTIDDDLQHPPDQIPILIRKLAEGYDVVYGVPESQQHGFFRNLASYITKRMLQASMGAQVASNISAFRAFRTEVREAFANYRGAFANLDVLLTWGTTHFAAVTVRHEARRIGKSNYTLTRLIIHAVNMITGYSIRPLQLASYLGFGFTLFGIGVFIYVIGRYILTGGSVPGFPFLASIIAIFSGVQLFVLGIMGEYLARMYFRQMDQPVYIVREHLNCHEPEREHSNHHEPAE